MLKSLFVSLLSLLISAANAQPKTDPLLRQLFVVNTNGIFQKLIKDPGNYRLQIIYTQINRDKHNKPVFKNYYFNYDPKLYFNPASMVKMPLAFLLILLIKLNLLF